MTSLTNWYFCKGSRFYLRGIVAGHPKLEDGTDTITSWVETLVR